MTVVYIECWFRLWSYLPRFCPPLSRRPTLRRVRPGALAAPHLDGVPVPPTVTVGVQNLLGRESGKTVSINIGILGQLSGPQSGLTVKSVGKYRQVTRR